MTQAELVRSQEIRIAEGMEAVLRSAQKEEAQQIQERLEQPGQRIRVVGVPPPPPIELFRGRQSELEVLADHLSTPGVRIVAIIGKTGMGKTALARKLLQHLEEGRAYGDDADTLDGIVYLSTRTSGITFERIYMNCAQMLGGEKEDNLVEYWGQRHNTAEKTSALLNFMKEGNYVILLDNLEERLDREGRVVDDDLRGFLDALSGREMNDSARLLITSRAALAVPRETQAYHRDLPLNDGLELSECLEVLRRLDAEGALGLRNAGDELLTELATSVGRAPRALELVASVLAHGCSLEEVMALVAGVSADPEQDPVRKLAEVNYGVLPNDARCVLEGLAVFGRPIPVVALDFLLHTSWPGLEVPGLVERLARTHTITHEVIRRPGTDCPAAVVSLHPTDDEVVTSHLPSDTAESLHLRAADYYAALRLPKPWFRIRQVEAQLLEFEHRMRGGDYRGAEAVMDTIDYSWTNHHKYYAHLMSLGYGEESIKRREMLLGKLSCPSREVHNRVSLGWVCRRMGKKWKAYQHFRQAARNARTCEDSMARVYAFSERGYFLTDNAAKHRAARRVLTMAKEAARTAGSTYGEAHAALGLAFAAFQMNENTVSIRSAEEALRLFRQVSMPLARYREIDCLVRLGMIYRKEGKFEHAIDTAQQGLRIAEEHKMFEWQAELNSGMGFHYRASGKFEEAISAHEEALRLFKLTCGMRREEAAQYSYLGNLYLELGQFREGRRAYEEAERIARAVELRRELSWIVANLGVLHCRLGEPYEASARQHEALKIVEENRHIDSKVVRLTDLAATHWALGQLEIAEQFVFSALQSAAQDEKFDLASQLPEAYVTSRYVEDKLPHEMQAPGDHKRRGALLARIYLEKNRLEDALAVVRAARAKESNYPYDYYLATLHALALMRLGRATEARQVLDKALDFATEALKKASSFYSAQYGAGFLYAALGHLSAGGERESRLQQSLSAYQAARKICDAPGVIMDAGRLLTELAKLGEDELLVPIRKALSPDGGMEMAIGIDEGQAGGV